MVVHGNARGRTIGYPTANLVLLDRTYMPADGVYVVDVEIQRQKYRAMASVGKNVTFDGESTFWKSIFLILIKIFMGKPSWFIGLIAFVI